MNLFDKINAFERLCNKLVTYGQQVVPLEDKSETEQLRIDPNTGRAMYTGPNVEQQQSGIPHASLTGPSTVTRRPSAPSAALGPAPTRQRMSPAPAQTPAKQMPPNWLAQYMKLEKTKEWVETEMAKMKEQQEAMLSVGPAVKS